MVIRVTGKIASLPGQQAVGTLNLRFGIEGVLGGQINLLLRRGYKFTEQFLIHLAGTTALQTTFTSGRILNIADSSGFTSAETMEGLNQGLKVPFVVVDKTFALRSETLAVGGKRPADEFQVGDNPAEFDLKPGDRKDVFGPTGYNPAAEANDRLPMHEPSGFCQGYCRGGFLYGVL